MREKLDEALVQLAIQISTYTDSPLVSGANGTLIRKTHLTELRERTKSGSGVAGSGGSSGGVRYVLSDAQGSSRAVMNNGTYGSSAIVTRHDYLPFGEEIGSGIGSRNGTQGYGASDTNRWKYGLTERDDTTGLDHTWWRKYESTSGRWTSPDPLSGRIGDPQSFNAYNYTGNDPVNFIDPSGLCPPGTTPAPDPAVPGSIVCIPSIPFGVTVNIPGSGTSPSVGNPLGGDPGNPMTIVDPSPDGSPGGGGGGGGGGTGTGSPPEPEPEPQDKPQLERNLSHDTQNYDRWHRHFAACAREKGFQVAVDGALFMAGQPLMPKRFTTPGASEGTSLLSRALGRGPTLSRGVWAPTLNRLGSTTAHLG